MQYPLTPPVKSIPPKQLNEKNSQQTQNDLKQFSISQLIDKQVDIEKMDTKQLVNYCHNEWKEWIRCMIQLQQCIRQEEQTAYKTKVSGINIPHAKVQDSTNIQLRKPQTLTNEETRQNRIQMPMYPGTFLGKDFDNMFRAQNSFPIPQTSFIGGSLNQTIPMKPSDHHQFTHNLSINQHRNPFPFPFPQDKPITEGFSGGGFENSSHFNQSIKMNFPNQDQPKNDEEQSQRKQ